MELDQVQLKTQDNSQYLMVQSGGGDYIDYDGTRQTAEWFKVWMIDLDTGMVTKLSDDGIKNWYRQVVGREDRLFYWTVMREMGLVKQEVDDELRLVG